jgi:hypothetical protein
VLMENTVFRLLRTKTRLLKFKQKQLIQRKPYFKVCKKQVCRKGDYLLTETRSCSFHVPSPPKCQSNAYSIEINDLMANTAKWDAKVMMSARMACQ